MLYTLSSIYTKVHTMSLSVPTSFDNKATAYEPVPPDNHVGVCVGLIELGTHMESFQGGPEKPVRRMKIQFELPGVARSDGSTGIIAAKFNLSFHEKASFRKMLDNWLGTGWPEKFKGEKLTFLIGLPAMVNVQQGPDKNDANRKLSWVSAVSKFPKGLPAPEMTRQVFILDLDDKYLPAKLSLWDAEMVRRSHEYQAGGFIDDAPHPSFAPPPKPNPAAALAGMPAGMPGFDETEGDELGDKVPF